MTHAIFPPLPSSELQPTRDTVQQYAQVIGKIRRALAPPQKHWFHVSLRIGVTGLTTTTIPAGDKTFEILLDLVNHNVAITTSRGEAWRQPITGQPVATFCQDVMAALAGMGIKPDIDRSLFTDTTPGSYDHNVAERYWQAMSQIHAVFQQFKGELRQETSPIQLWPHHIDLAMLWFSGRLVPGQDPANEEHADEQMNFGFTPGDAGISDPYFYITAYPTPNGFTDAPLPGDAKWTTEGFTGALLMYDALVDADNPKKELLNFLRAVQQAGAALMK